MVDDKTELKYGAFRRAVREVLPKSEKRKLDTSMRRRGIPLHERRRVIAVLGVFALGMEQGMKEARNG